jgi:hypothetical protein
LLRKKKKMSRSKRAKDKRLPPFVALPWDMLNGKAYQSLKYSAAKALPYFWGKLHVPFNDPAQYETDIHFPYAEGKRYGFSPGTFSKIIQELIAKGFIDPVDKGGLRGHGKSYNVFRISRRWEKLGTSAFQPRDWRCFVPRPRLKDNSKKEMCRYKKGKETTVKDGFISQNEAVEANSS